ncbi:hypothetical protein AOQ84DRAFT_325530 [Glonium stellatum]|uniref:DUF7702 domain-containing protein n=1 Tax=Glonium stellatum TaxID=574774 RepID=A0A8E2ESA5_9PEZI|nr:hypothetical protein AOQ84DRAFT_325530 [Glonium stellatum]
MVDSREALAIAQLVIYIPVFLCVIFIIFRHGFNKQAGWRFLGILCLVRIVGSYFEIAAVHHPDNKTDVEWSAILQSVGISPLLLTALGLLKRIIDETSTHIPSNSDYQMPLMSFGILGKLAYRFGKPATAAARRSRIIQIIYLPATIALILCISGGSDEASTNPSDQKSGKTEIRVGIIMFVFIYIALFLLTIITARDFGKILKGERRMFIAVVLSLPFLAVRILYGILTQFSNSKTFSMMNPQIWARILMSVIEEFIVVIMFTIVGLTIPKYSGDMARTGMPQASRGSSPDSGTAFQTYPVQQAQQAYHGQQAHQGQQAYQGQQVYQGQQAHQGRQGRQGYQGYQGAGPELRSDRPGYVPV